MRRHLGWSIQLGQVGLVRVKVIRVKVIRVKVMVRFIGLRLRLGLW